MLSIAEETSNLKKKPCKKHLGGNKLIGKFPTTKHFRGELYKQTLKQYFIDHRVALQTVGVLKNLSILILLLKFVFRYFSVAKELLKTVFILAC